jgi:CubicO group peptidase (beta-lactamase class C family)
VFQMHTDNRFEIVLVLSLGLTLCMPLHVPAEIPEATSGDKPINELLEPIRKKHKLPALAGAIVNTKGLVAIGVVGIRKRGSEVPVNVDDRFHIGSDTKAMTAALIGRLIESGRLNWDTPLEKAFPALAASMSPDFRRVTFLHLLSHHSGLPADFKDEDAWEKLSRAGTIRKQREAAVKMALSEKLASKPGEKYTYSNLNYVMAAAIAEKAADASWEDLMTKELFQPLGMRSAGFGTPGTAKKIDQPWPHDARGEPVEPGPDSDNPPVMGPAGRVHCSLPDWAKFIADQLKGARGERALLHADTYKRLLMSPFSDHFYTLGGWTGSEVLGKLILGHDGSNRLNYAAALMMPSNDFAVLVITNQGGPGGPGEKGCHEARDALVKYFAKRP